MALVTGMTLIKFTEHIYIWLTRISCHSLLQPKRHSFSDIYEDFGHVWKLTLFHFYDSLCLDLTALPKSLSHLRRLVIGFNSFTYEPSTFMTTCHSYEWRKPQKPEGTTEIWLVLAILSHKAQVQFLAFRASQECSITVKGQRKSWFLRISTSVLNLLATKAPWSESWHCLTEAGFKSQP